MFDRDPATPARELALDCLRAGIEAANPETAVRRHCAVEDGTLRIRDAEYDLGAFDRILVLGGGKAADDLAVGLESLLGDRIDDGLVVTNEQTADPQRVTVRTGGHPTPDEDSVAGAEAVLEAAETADERTLVLAAITGGGSALLCAPAEGLSLDAVQRVTDRLLDAGAPIEDVNTVRRACSAIKGGGLAAAAAPATVVGLLVSDVVGDEPSVIASGPTVPAAVDPEAALAVLERYDVDAPDVEAWLAAADPESEPSLAVDNHVIASARDAIDAAVGVAREADSEPCLLSTRIEGEAREAGRFHAAVAAEAVESGNPVAPPAVLLSAGETTVTVTGDGTGGPNLEWALAAGLDAPEGSVFAAVDTDGSDGSTDAAGAIVDAGTVDDEAAARRALADNDSYPFLDGRDALLRSGATGTNVNDLRVVVLGGE
ncbi:glycerate kinase type-2 family protein [Natronomonas amylolytica]|uniref:glycerate kinase type-2 family protein n=1 Tax=Natronomonas amylolytica TaxID=3108498 RepID=UPI003009B142